MTLTVPLSNEVYVATDVEGCDIFTSTISVLHTFTNEDTGSITVECTLPQRPDVRFGRVLTDLDDTSEATLVAALALDIEANFPAEKPSEAEADAPPEDADDEEPTE
jgi:hypothetical protein